MGFEEDRAKRMIDISGIDKAALLVALYDGTIVLGLGAMHPNVDQPLSREQAQAEIDKSPSFDYLWGRPIKVNLVGNLVDPILYDRDAGKGAFARAVEKARDKQH